MSLSDLIISNVVTPNSGTLGAKIPVSWVVANQGIETTDSAFWYEGIYLSEDEILDNEDDFIFNGWVRNPLTPNGQYEITRDVTLPRNVDTGERYLIFTVDEDDLESETNENNNVYVVPFELNLPNVDLTITEVNVPATIVLDGEEIDVSWTVANQGTDTVINNDWYDEIYLSEDEFLSEDDIYLDDRSTEEDLSLVPGDSYTSTEDLILPTNVGTGDRFLLFVVDEENEQWETDENNNVYAAPIELNAPNEIDDVDLIVTDATVPNTAALSERIDVSWTVTNQGSDAVISNDWYDKIYLSEDEILDDNDIFLDDRDTEDYLSLASGDSYAATQNFDLPSDAGTGDRFLLFVVDEENEQWEKDENNNVYATPIELYAPNVDLTVTDAVVPTTAALNGESIEVSFTITNQGSEATTSDELYDRIYLSEDEILDEEDLDLDGVFTDDNLPIISGDTYTATKDLILPTNAGTGDRYILFVVDEQDYQSETDETNNVYAAPIELNAPDVDLTITSTNAPATAFLSEKIAVSWTTANQGTERALGSPQYDYDYYYYGDRAWYDSIYLSDDETFDEEDTQVYREWNYDNSPLAANNNYTNTQNIRIPSNVASGEKYLLFIADSDDNKQLETDDTNNVYSLPIELTSLDVDLAITDATYPSLANRGEVIELSWTVANQGTEATASYSNYELTDYIYFSEDEILDSTDYFLGSSPVGNNTPLEGGNNYTATQNVTIPTDIEPGEYYLFFASDFTQEQSETDRTNNLWRSPIEIGTDGANLIVSDVNAPTAATLNETIEVSWTVTNQGGIATPNIDYYDWNSSYDYIYISDDETLDDSDTFVTSYNSRNNHPLAGGDSYSVTENINIPNTTAGDRYLLLVADGNEDIWETNQDDNVLAVPISLREPDVNLVITDATAPTETPWGGGIELSWTVENQGTETASASYWYDYVYISDDEILDETDTYLTSRYTSDGTPLEAGGSYTATQNVNIPQTEIGDRYLIFESNGGKEQSETNEEDNVLALPITVRDPDVDLVITDTNAPTVASQGDRIEVSWTVANQGSDAANGSNFDYYSSTLWYDYVYISDDEILDSDDDYFTSSSVYNQVSPGEDHTQTQTLTLPHQIATGDRYIIFAADRYESQFETNETNNTVAVPFTLNDLDVDLVTTDTIVPASAKIGDSIEISWTIANQGSDSTNASNWYDYIYISDDEILDDQDDYLTNFYRNGEPPIAAGDSYTHTQNVFLSNELDTGDRYLIFATDRNEYQNQLETDETNNFVAVPFELSKSDVDLVVTDTTAPVSANKGDTIELSWTVTNQGNDTINASYWYDYIYISNDEIFDFEDDYLASFYRGAETPIASGESYTRTETVSLSFTDLAAGDRYIIFATDRNQNQLETDETNNFVAVPFTLNDLDVDLVITDATAPGSAHKGDTIELSWTVTNQGNDTTNTSYWYDYIYISDDEILDDGDDELANFYINGSSSIASGESYTRTQNVFLSNELDTGDHYLIFASDQYESQFETDETNNTVVVPFELSVPDVDLVVSDTTAPVSANKGDTIELSWTVTNQGSNSTTAPYWYDYVYISDDEILDSEDDYLTYFYTGGETLIASGESYTQTQNVFLSDSLTSGDRYLIFAADNGKNQSETDETNNTVVVPFELSVPDVDLVITDTTAPVSANKGDTIELSWTVTNQGKDSTNTSYWYDYIYLSDDEILDDGDDELANFYINGSSSIASGESYTRTQSLFLSNELDIGDRYLIFATDRYEYQNQLETDETNNFVAVPFELNESDRDLVITDIVAPTTALRGETIEISWADSNLGTLPIDGYWYDRIYLSTNDVAGDDDDIYLTEYYYAETISAGGSAARTQQVTIPVSLTEGTYNLYIEGDRYDYVTEIDEENNTTFLPGTIEISSPDVDLTVSDISAPTTGVRGEYIDVSWTVNNQGGEATTGYWYDSIYLSTNDVVGDNDDVEIESIYYGEEIAAGNSKIRTAQVYLPDWVDDGNYHLVVGTDTYNNLAEKDETNNEAIANDVISLFSADLIVTNVTAPLEGLSGEDVEVTWTVTNQGDVAATGGWYDTVYFSEDASNTFSDRWLDEFYFEGTIEPGESITRTQTVTLPIDLQGEGVIKVDTDSGYYGDLVESDENNNIGITEQPFTSVLAPYPNLVVGEVTAPNEIFSGQRVPIEWTVSNTGTGATNASYWYDTVWLSLDDVIDSSDTYLGQVRNASYLESGQGYSNSLTVELPKEAEGNYHFLVQTDDYGYVFENENENDNSSLSNLVNIEPSPVPDLQVTIVNGATQAFSGQQSTVSYTVTNKGEGRATGFLYPIYEWIGNSSYEVYTEDSGWTDYIYISEDEVLDDDDYYVGAHRRDTDYQVTVTETITRDFLESQDFTTPTTTETNTYQSLEESYYGATNYAESIWGYDHTWGSDYQVGGLTDSWTRFVEDNYYFANGNYHDTYEGDVEIRYDVEIRPVPASLEPGESYSVSQDVILPIGVSGDYHVLVKTDRNNEVDELTFETNNTGFDPNPTQINLTPPPDLEVELINSPTEALASHELAFNYSIVNFGSTVTPNYSWQDAFYLSEDDQLDPETDLYLGNAYHYGNLQPGDGYDQEVSFTLPDEIEGEYYLFVATDREDRVFELDNDNNIRLHNQTIAIASRPADLVISSFIAPETVEAGKGLLVEWTVENQGTGDTAVDSWSDRLVASTDEELGNDDDVILQTFYHNGLLDVGNSYSRSETVNVPFELVGDYNLFLVSDVGDRVYEAAAEDNSALLPITVTRETADLQVTQVTAADTAQSGKLLNVNWTVQNLGTATTNSNYWYDEVFLSPDLTLGDGNDISLGSAWRGDVLETDAEYQVSRNFELPEDLEGNYHVIVKTDSDYYGDRGTVIEDGGENNNEKAVTEATVISLSPVPDLVVESVEVPAEGVSGQFFALTWTVRNDGVEDINNESWRTTFYLSRDQVFDRNSDTYIGYATQQGNLIEGEFPEANTYSLAAGESVTQTNSFHIPNGLSGTLYAFAVVDSGESIYERDGESNNVGFDGNSMQVILPPPADLVVGTITIPENGVPGQETTIEYLVENQGDNAAVGNWTDSIYISADPEWDVNDPLFGRVNASGPIESGGSYTNSLTAALPGITPGEYYVIVRSDIYNAIAEPDEANNIDASEETFPADAEVLALDTPVTGTLAGRQATYYRIDVEAGETLKVNFDSESDFAANELYLSYGEVPTRSNFDFGATEPFAADQEIVVPNTRAGSYYLLAYGNVSSDYTVAAEVLDFSLLDIGTDTGSNVGQVTTTVLGAEFTPETEVSLVLADGSDHPAAKVVWKDNAELWATFDLEDLEPGQYDVKVQDGAETAVLEDRFTVTDGAPGDVQVTMNVPPALRPGQQGVATIKYINTGETDVIAPLITLNANNANLRLPGQSTSEDSELQFLGINDEGPAGILSPGASGSINVIFEPTVDNGSVGFSLSQISDPDELYDLSDFEESLRPEGLTDEDWNNIWQNFTKGVGETAGDYNAVLADNATHLSQLGDRTNNVGELVNFEFLQASGYGSLIERNSIGSFGRGQPSLLSISVIADTNGNVTIQDGNTTLEFERQTDGTYSSPAGDSLTLVSEDGVYKLIAENSSTTVFRADGKLDYIEDIHGNRLQTAYTEGQLTELISSNGDRVTFAYNEFGRVSQVTDNAGRVSTYSYDETGEYLLSVTAPEGTTEYTYNTASDPAQSAITSITYPDGTQRLFEYDDRGRLSSQSFSDGSEALTYEYDTAGGVTVTDASGASLSILLNNNGQIGQLVDDLGRITKYQYDEDGNLTEILQPDGTTTTLEYENGNVVRQVDGLGNETKFTYDPVFNQLANVEDGRGNAINYNYNDTGNLEAITYADGNGEQYNYDPQGRLIESVNRRGQSIQYEYSDRDLLIKKTLTDGSEVSFTYDDAGNLASTTDATGTTSLEYDDADRLTKITYPNGRFVGYTYDEAGRRTQMVDQNGFTVNYSYNEQGRLSELTDGDGNSLVAYQYNELGLLSREDNGNGTYTTYEYDSAGQTTSVVNYASDDTVNSRFDYTYNEQGLRSSMTTLEGTWNYGYDAIGQLTSVTLPDGQTIDYQYDAAGNRIAVTDGEITSDYVTNNLNQYTSAGNAVFTYDTDGNIATKTENGQTWTYDYDSENRLVGVNGPDGSWTYEYDVFGNRTASIHNGERTEYLIDPLGNTGLADVIGEYNANGDLLANYVHGIGLETRVGDGSASYFDFDALGSTAGLTSASGDYVNQYSYSPFGKDLTKTETIANPFEYVGQWGVMDEANGLDFMRARYYDSQAGRFINPDPIGINGGLNLYQYVQNNPTNLIDPSGLICWKYVQDQAGGFLNVINGFTGFLGFKVLASGVAALAGTSALATIGGIGIAVAVAASAGWALGTGINQLLYGNTYGMTGNLFEDIGNGLFGDQGKSLGAVADGLLNLISGRINLKARPNAYKVDLNNLTGKSGELNALNGLIGRLVNLYEKITGDKLTPSDCDKEPPKPPEDDDTQTDNTDIVAPSDPNDILGPEGFGEERWITASETLPYTIRFENQETATAPAQEVIITHPLDPDLDFRTFRLGNFGWGEYYFEVPENSAFYQERLDLTEEQGFLVEVVAGVDVAEGEAFWTLTTIDPETGEIPEDALAGFLPPNNEEGVGDGFVTYTIEPSPDAETGDVVDAEATIIFDTEEPIDTPPIFNTLDADVPTSTAEALPEISETEDFIVKWSGNDAANGSALAGYTIYVSDNGGEFTPWLENTTLTEATYTGEPGHTYAFYTIATDNAGNRQETPAEAQAIIKVAGGEPPVVGTNQGLTVEEGATELITTSILQITDPDSPATEISYTLTDLPDNGTLILEDENLILDSSFTQADIDNNLLTYQHDGGETTEDSFSFTASDFSENSIDITTFNIEITPVNDAPTLENPLIDLVTQEDSELNFTIPADTFTDVDAGNVLTYTATLEDGSELPSWLTFNSATRTFNGTPTNSDVGTLNVKVTATDNGNEIVTDSFVLTIENVDDAPVVQNELADLIVDEDADNSVIDLSNIFTDIDNDDSAIEKSVLANTNEELVTATIEGNNLTLDYLDHQSGTADITIQGTSNGQTVTETFTVTVNPIDDAPIVQNAIANLTVDEDAENTVIDLTNIFSDIDNDDSAIAVTVAGNSNESLVTATIQGHNLTLDYQDNQSGTAEITIRGESNGETVEDTFTVTVNPVDDAPSIQNAIADLTVDEDADNSVIDLSNIFTDIDNDDSAIEKSVLANTNEELVTATIVDNELILDYQDERSGTADITIQGTSNGQTVTETFTVTVNPVPDGLISIADSSGNPDDASILFGTPLSQFREGISDSDLIRPSYPDTQQYIDITNTGDSSLNISEISIDAPGVTAELPEADILLNPNETQRIQLTYSPSVAGENFSIDDGLTIISNAANKPEMSISLSGKSTFDSDINYDGLVSFGDLGPLNSNWGRENTGANWDATADINGDGLVSFGDLGSLNQQWNLKLTSI